jgi:plasmid rolling circle replication initiator protein Rep
MNQTLKQDLEDTRVARSMVKTIGRAQTRELAKALENIDSDLGKRLKTALKKELNLPTIKE